VHRYVHLRDLYPFPTRRSSDLEPDRFQSVTAVVDGDESIAELYIDGERVARGSVAGGPNLIEDQSLNTIGRSPWPDVLFKGEIRSEEHTSELQSRFDLVCRLLL